MRELCQRLADEGWIDPWLDEEKLALGQHWAAIIEETIEAADVVIIFLSRQSVQKEGFVQRELTYAWEFSLEKPRDVIFLIPFRLDDCEPPRYLRTRQWGDYFGEKKERTYAGLLQSLKQRHEQKLRLETERRLFEEAQEKAREALEAQQRLEAEALAGKAAEEKMHLEAEERAWQELKEKIEREAHEKVRLDMEARLRLEAEALARAEYAAREKALSAAAEPARPIQRAKPTAPAALPEWLTLSGMDFCRIPAGSFLMGSSAYDKDAYDDEKPQHPVEIPYDYWMARFPVTNAQYAQYVSAVGAQHPLKNWQSKKDHPLVDISWNDASIYCQWLNNVLKGQLPRGYVLCLPSEAEWEKAAHEVDGRIYPWGNTFDINKCNVGKGRGGDTTPVGLYSPQGDSPYGCADMSGNVWERTRSIKKAYPYQANDGREDEKSSSARVLRGGSYINIARLARCSCRLEGDINFLRYNIGFRVALAPPFS